MAAIVCSSGHPLQTAVKWHQLTFANEGNFHHGICAIAVTKKAVVLAFHFGGLLQDPTGMFRIGASKFGRRLDYRSADEIDATSVRDFVDQGVERLPYFRENWRAIQAGG